VHGISQWFLHSTFPMKYCQKSLVIANPELVLGLPLTSFRVIG
jgi:hypothetical protein